MTGNGIMTPFADWERRPMIRHPLLRHTQKNRGAKTRPRREGQRGGAPRKWKCNDNRGRPHAQRTRCETGKALLPAAQGGLVFPGRPVPHGRTHHPARDDRQHRPGLQGLWEPADGSHDRPHDRRGRGVHRLRSRRQARTRQRPLAGARTRGARRQRGHRDEPHGRRRHRRGSRGPRG